MAGSPMRVRRLYAVLPTLLALSAIATAQPPPGSRLLPASVKWSAKHDAWVTAYELNVTIQWAAPDCFHRPVVLVSGILQPELEIGSGDILKITLRNNMPPDLPTTSSGISLHYHGLNMYGTAAWLDGVAYIAACPVAPGKEHTYQFKVDDPPGTYIWHDHASSFKGDGLQGPLIVRPARQRPLRPTAAPPAQAPGYGPELWQYDGDYTIFLDDWYHTPTATLLMQLNMPYDKNSSSFTANSGVWNWVGNPQGILINGRGFYGDCPLFPGLGGSTTASANCTAPVFTVAPGRSAQQPWASANNPGCTHDSFEVEFGKAYRFRVISSVMLLFMSVCFEGHNVTAIAVDASPMQPLPLKCVEVGSGQRVDVLLTANGSSGTNYWISATPQYRKGAPSGFAVLRYPNTTADTFPTTPPPQADAVGQMTIAQTAMLRTAKELLVNNVSGAAAAYLPRGKANLTPPNATKIVYINISQPLLRGPGVIRWALNNVVMPGSPPCSPLMDRLRADHRFLAKNAVNASQANATGTGLLRMTMGDVSLLPSIHAYNISPVPLFPALGLNIVPVPKGAVVDIVINNGPGNGFNGDYRPLGQQEASRNTSEVHPFHLHGHHFWVLGTGMGVYDSAASSGLNTVDPIYRDTVTIPMGGWAKLRYVADNPGVWPLHCHILAHEYMGQQVFFAEAISELAKPPEGRPKCPSKCRLNFAPYDKAWLRKTYGSSGYELPPLY